MKKDKNPKVSSADGSTLDESLNRLKSEGYSVMPSAILGDGARSLYDEFGLINFTHKTTGVVTSGCGFDGNAINHIPGGFTSAGSEYPVSSCGASGKGYIAWGSLNNLPNIIAISNSLLVYTASAIKFNIDTACGNGIRPMYRIYSGVGGQMAEVEIPYELAGKAIQTRIRQLQKEIYNLIAQKENVVVSDAHSEHHDDLLQATAQVLEGLKQDEDKNEDAPRYPHRNGGEDYYKALACDYLDDTIRSYNDEINDLKRDLGIWRTTNSAVQKFLKKTNSNLLNHQLFSDLISFGTCFPEIRLSQHGSKQNLNSKWKPTIESIGWNNALSSRLESYDDHMVSRHVYLSNSWLNPDERYTATENNPEQIDCIPALDPSCPAADLENAIRRFRIAFANDPDNDGDYTQRPCRFALPVTYTTPGRAYYSIPSYWSIYNDIYQFASTIIRDRAIRKQNESMFSYIVYVHSDYLDRLTNQINAQQTEEEKQAIKSAEINKIKSFLANKKNNGAAMAACTFTGNDGKDHDAFRVEQVSFASKSAAEADKTEISDISSIILFAMECHPDLIGSTPGGASKSGGTYQREMLQIKQAKLAPTQNLIIDVYNMVRDYNGWDSHLCWHISQRTLTTLDRSHSGVVED